LPSVTAVIGATIAKPELVGWASKVTRDNISGMVDVLSQDHRDALLDTMADGDMLAEYMKENRLRADDVRDEAAELGTENHETLEHLAKCYINEGEETAEIVATRMLNRSESGHVTAICGWWLDTYPRVAEAEMRLFSLSLGVAGTVDLVLKGTDGYHVIDLKTRGAGRTAYRTDHVQVDGYAAMYEEMTGNEVTERSVLVCREDGTFDMYPSTVPVGTFAATKKLYDLLRGSR
jgi:hypothetical protein